jgi:hypothetical protein
MWGVTVEYAAIVQATSRELCADSLILKVRAQEVRGARRLHGASDVDGPSNLDASVIASLIGDASLCGDCLARKTGIPLRQVGNSVTRIRGTMKVTSKIARCDGCLKATVVYRLGTTFPMAGGSHSPAREVVEELESGPFCTKCLATRLRLTRFSIEHVVAELRRAFVIDTIEPCLECGSRKTITLHGRNQRPQQ